MKNINPATPLAIELYKELVEMAKAAPDKKQFASGIGSILIKTFKYIMETNYPSINKDMGALPCPQLSQTEVETLIAVITIMGASLCLIGQGKSVQEGMCYMKQLFPKPPSEKEFN